MRALLSFVPRLSMLAPRLSKALPRIPSPCTSPPLPLGEGWGEGTRVRGFAAQQQPRSDRLTVVSPLHARARGPHPAPSENEPPFDLRGFSPSFPTPADPPPRQWIRNPNRISTTPASDHSRAIRRPQSNPPAAAALQPQRCIRPFQGLTASRAVGPHGQRGSSNPWRRLCRRRVADRYVGGMRTMFNTGSHSRRSSFVRALLSFVPRLSTLASRLSNHVPRRRPAVASYPPPPPRTCVLRVPGAAGVEAAGATA